MAYNTIYSIAAVGDWESVMGFKAIGLKTCPVTSVEEAVRMVHKLAEEDCAIIYLTETLAKDMNEIIEKYKKEQTPAIILIPGREGSLGIGKKAMDEAIERAVGTGII